MGNGVPTGWMFGVALAGAISALACSGASESMGEGDDSSDDGFGGASGSSTGGASSGGASGGSSLGGTISVAGAGGAPTCDCPVADYGLVIEGDGPTVTMPYNGLVFPSADQAPLACGESPLRGTLAGCGYGITVSACEGPMSTPPCFDIDRDGIDYVSRAGEPYHGRVMTTERGTVVPGVESGTLTAEVTNAVGDVLVLTVSYTFCTTLGNLRIVC
jgi:hypothetical protein